ncbi:MAG TPA: lysophospholipid acyltransferase family protein [Burkholderiaceae bacterium]|nr:lysophospholipid acyltransferase family protein [Burkholderiaceae bacterium]
MRSLRALARLVWAVLHTLHGLAIVLLQFDRLDAAARHARIRWWSGRMLRVLGVGLRVDGVGFHPGGVLLAANHVSWLDILAIHAVCPQARFVAKADVKHWPLVGRLVGAGGTLFIERERKRDAVRVVHQMAEALKAGETVAVFPEGTTSDGQSLLPFHANLLQAAIATAVPVQAVALRFSDDQSEVSAAAPYVGETTLVQSLWWIACAQGLCAHVGVLPPRGTRHAERRAVAALIRAEIMTSLTTSSQLPAELLEQPAQQ